MKAHLTIIDEIGARLGNVKKVNGYANDFKVIRRATTKPFVHGDLPAVNYWPTEDEYIDKEYQLVKRLLHVNVEAYAKTRDLPFTDIALELSNDICIALFRDTSTPNVTDVESRSLGLMVDFLIINTITPILGEGQAPWCGVLIELSINYRLGLGDPITIEK